MVKRKLNRDELRVKAALLEGQTMRRASDTLTIKYTTVRGITHRLEYLGEIRRIPTCKSPMLFEDPRALSKERESPKNETNVGYVPTSSGDDSGEHDRKETRIHLNGSVLFEVLHVGNYDTIRDKNEYVLGEWTKTVSLKGRTDRYGEIRVFGDVYRFSHRHGSNGSNTLALWVPEIWAMPGESRTYGEDTILDRSRHIAALLRLAGWRLSEPEIRGDMHYAHNDPALLRHMDRSRSRAGAELWADTSHGDPELEVGTAEDNDILVELPTIIRNIWSREQEREALFDRRYDKVMSMLEKLMTVQEHTALVMANATVDARMNTGVMFG